LQKFSLSVPDEAHSRNVLCTLNLISTFLLLRITVHNNVLYICGIDVYY